MVEAVQPALLPRVGYYGGRWFRGFAHNLGCCSVTEVEMWGAYDDFYNMLGTWGREGGAPCSGLSTSQ